MSTTRALGIVFGVTLAACGQEGPQGPPGPQGAPGTAGGEGTNGANGANGTAGTNGTSSTTDSGAPVDAGWTPPPPSSGTRIKAKTSTVTTTTTTSDGASSVSQYTTSGWFDTQRGEPCTFTAAKDGKTRCLPTTLAVRDVSSGLYYLDAACSQPITFASKATPACGPTVTPPTPSPKYLIAYATGAACGGQSLRLLGASVAPGANVYIKIGACSATPAQPTLYDYYGAPGVEIPPTDFVESTTSIVTTE